MLKHTAIILSTVALIAHVGADDSNVLVRFRGGIGVTPLVNATTPNVVRGVKPAGPWRIADLRATVMTDGSIKVRGQGLLLAAGNSIGTNANQRVFATLICETTDPVPRSTSTEGVPLELNGDFRIDDTLTPGPPAECASPVLLIRSTSLTDNLWFAAGIPVFGEEDE